MPVPSNPQDLINIIREKLFNNTSGLIEEPDLREVLENIVKVLDAKFSMFSPNLTEEQYAQWNLILDYMLRETKGVLTTSSSAPTEKGKYLLASSGTYTNLGGLVATADKLNYAYFDGTTWSLIAVDMPVQDLTEIENKITEVKNSIILNISSKNKFDKSKITLDKYLNTTNGSTSTASEFWTSDFIEIKENTNYIASPHFTFICFYREDESFISGIGEAGQTLITPPIGAKKIKVSDNDNHNNFQIEEGEVSTSYEDFYEFETLRFEEKYVTIEKRVVTDGINYNLIRKLVKSITDASESKRYRIIVPRGEWHECDLSGHSKWIEIVGEDLFGTVIYNDGLSTKLTPSDYSTPQYSNTALNQIPQHYKHVVYTVGDTNIKNLTIEARGNIKYCAHIDSTLYNEVNIIDVRFLRTAEEVNNCVGIGLKPNQVVNLSGSTFFRTDNQPAIFVHNSENQLAGSKLLLDNTFYIGCSYVLVGEMGSNQEDWIYLRNAETNIDSNQFITVICEINPSNLPYNFRINTIGTKINSVVQLPYQGNNNPRPNFIGYIIGRIG